MASVEAASSCKRKSAVFCPARGQATGSQEMVSPASKSPFTPGNQRELTPVQASGTAKRVRDRLASVAGSGRKLERYPPEWRKVWPTRGDVLSLSEREYEYKVEDDLRIPGAAAFDRVDGEHHVVMLACKVLERHK